MKLHSSIGVVLCALILTGCSTTVPVQRRFPNAPAELLQPAPALKPLPANTTELSVLIDNANENYSTYRVLREHYEAWQQWYQEQRANFDTVK